MKHLEKNEPWLDENGESHSIEDLRDLSRSWSPEIWIQYLESLKCKETKEARIREHERRVTEILQILSKSWSPATWELYLKTLEGQKHESDEFSVLGLERLTEKFSFKKSLEDEQNNEIKFKKPLKSDLENVRTALKALKANHRRILRLIYFQGKSIQEAADKLKTSRENITQIHERSLKAFRSCLCQSTELSKGGRYGH